MNDYKESVEPQWTEDVQRLLISFALSDANSFIQSRNIIEDRYFEDRLRPAVRYILEYADTYKSLPTAAQVAATTRVQIDKFDGIEPQHAAWYLDNIEKFCRHRALELAVLSSLDLLGQGNYAEVETRVKEAMQISLITDIGTDYYYQPRARMERMRDDNVMYSTGWDSLDEKLFGGLTNGSLTIFLGNSGAGKSLVLQNLAINQALLGNNVVYFSMELKEDLVSQRLDAMNSGLGTREILKYIDMAASKVEKVGEVSGKLFLKKMPDAGTTTNHLRAYLKELEIKTGIKPDVIIVDYLDIMAPNNSKLDLGNFFVKDHYVSQELRAFASDTNTRMITASQMNRSSVEAQDFDQSHVAGGISKINNCDNAMAIYAPPSMREQGKYQFQFLKTRSAAAVGSRLDMKYNPVCLRILDVPVNDNIATPLNNASLREELKKDVPIQGGAVTPTNKANVLLRLQRLQSLTMKAAS